LSGVLWFVVEVLLYGALWAYLVLLLPALVIAQLKEDWILLALGAVAAAVVLLGLFSARPTPILGTDGESLQYSVDPVFTFTESCRPKPNGKWTCYSYDSASSGDAPYLTEVDWAGCWTASTLDRGALAPRQRELAGCVTIFDHIRLLGRALD